MGQAYTPALQVVPRTKIVRTRELPLPGRHLVQLGDQVQADTSVLSADLPGDLTILRVADRLGFDADDVVPAMRVKVGDRLEKGAVICQIKSFFGLFTSQLTCPASGVVEFFTEANAHLGIRHEPVPLYVNAYIRGSVCGIEEGKSVSIEAEGALIQGIFGVGGERQGTILPLPVANDALVTDSQLKEISGLRGSILIGGAAFTPAALAQAALAEVSAVVTGSVDAETLLKFAGHEIGVSVTGDEDVPLTLIIT